MVMIERIMKFIGQKFKKMVIRYLVRFFNSLYM
jgi:hypothetical protein